MKKIKCVYQSTSTDCGGCCVLMILNYYGISENIISIREKLSTGRDGSSLYSIKRLFTEYKLNAKVYESDINAFRHINLPVIVSWQNNHYVIVEKIRDDMFYIIDPMNGRYKVTFEEMHEFYNGNLIHVEKGKEYKKIKKRRKKSYYEKIIFDKKGILIILAFLLCVYYAMTFTFPTIIQRGIDILITGEVMNNDYMAIFLLFIIFQFLIILFRNIIAMLLEKKTYKILNYKIIESITKHSLKFFQNYSTEDILFRLNSVGIVNNILISQVLNTAFQFGGIIVLSAFVYINFSSIYIYYIIYVLLIILVISLFVKRITSFDALFLKENNNYSRISNKFVSAIHDIKGFGIEEKISKKWKEEFNSLYNVDIKRSIWESVFRTSIDNITLSAPLLFLLLVFLISESNYFTTGTLASFYYVLVIITNFLVSIISDIRMYLFSGRYLKVVEELILNEPDINNKFIDYDLESWDIKIRDLEYKYTNFGKSILSNCNLDINYGEVVGIIGESGSGKSTLGKLILGLCTPTNGNIRLGGVDKSLISEKDYKRNYGFVSQDVKLFYNTIIENITMGDKTIGLEDVQKVCRIVNIQKDIEEMPMKYYTYVSNMGNNLSVGQKQRIALARALIRRPRVLILDEFNSSLDKANDKEILDNLKELSCSIILITHKQDTVNYCDRVYKVENGTVALVVDNSLKI